MLFVGTIRKAVGVLKQGLMGHLNRSMEGSTEEQFEMEEKDSEGKNISKWFADCYCDVLAKNVAGFAFGPKNIPDVKLKNFRLMVLTDRGNFKRA